MKKKDNIDYGVTPDKSSVLILSKDDKGKVYVNNSVNLDKYSSIELAVYGCIKEMTDNNCWKGIDFIYDELKENGIYEITIPEIKKAIRTLKKDGLIYSSTVFDEDTNQLCGKGWIARKWT